jgi:DNA polymerase-3 subunit gamma/tau
MAQPQGMAQPQVMAQPQGMAQPQAGDGYQALYRRYRPSRFSEVRGQDHVTRALRNAVREGRVAHAYLFSGPRGTGKTSTARILAMALNCEAPADGEPDGTCQSCLAVRAGASMDVFELDAASNRRLEEMRDLLSRVALGTPGRWKVYIVDEVHQLTPDAASALLKTLEEPPSHVVFVLATTDPQKVLPTILSRTQHFEFHLLGGDVLTALLEEINRDAGLGLPAGAVRLAVQKGRGSARDAESALEQLAAIGGEEGDTSYIDDLFSALAERDAGAVLQAVAKASLRGVEPRRLGSELVERLREAFLAFQAPALVQLPPAEAGRVAELSRAMGLPLLVRSMEAVGKALVEMRDSVDPRVTLEVALVRLASPALGTSLEALVERIERLERALAALPAQGATLGKEPPTAPPAPSPGPGVRTGAGPQGEATLSGAVAGGQSRSVADGPPAPSAPESTNQAGGSSQARPVGGPAEARAALGAFLKGAQAGSSPPARTTVGTSSEPPPGEAAVGASPAPAPAGPAAPVGPGPSKAAEPCPPAVAGTGLPTRDELTKAWGDVVLGRLEKPGQFYLAHGRFTEVSDTAVLAFPDKALMSRAAKYVGEAEEVLAGHFGRRIPLRLVVEGGGEAFPPLARGAAKSQAKGRAPNYDPVEPVSPDELAPLPAPALSAEQRVLEAFPGAVLEQ